ncbi:SH3 domain-containing protein [Acinetobacter rudis]|uniref:SH3b domain-containing protein n=2 Tax=Acinetobacter rudis TaxID=632955 RepID=S3N371_9GAMM|nr:SH3 domain-containing protein [Acinetobacter rudis]EPF74500.1 hypothetical protein F945_01539 [Acinetobacter rudis CIP 110305]
MGFNVKNIVYGITIISLISAQMSYADLGLISDQDGFVNVRESPSLNAKVIAKLKNDSVVSCVLEEKNAKFCLITSADLKDSGYVYKDRVDFFKAYTQVPVFKSSPLNANYKNNLININIEAKTADTNIQNYTKNALDEYHHYQGKKIFGTDGQRPDDRFIQLSQINIDAYGTKVKLNTADLEALFLPLNDQGKNELSTFKALYKGQNLYLFNTLNEGGAAAYHVLIHIYNGKLIDKKIWHEDK